ncbi:DNA-dependent metalloprotease SPRTN [Dryobates pubescens]|uniref:DNA-dependent metalloprotease SPRTN n=1 Tax=Dryobates pubescens TaxID=118200 RepID=UPI0023B92A00|nr:DNA-dependent metalloprotease SPRTN [Dryobates pubescens]
MEAQEDFALALQLQELWEAEEKEAAAAAAATAVAACSEVSPDPSPYRPLSVVDEAWELLDPSPDVHGLFVQFNEMLFWGRLAAVEVSWSPRMTLCAGVCRYEGRGGMCSIRLSEPLLKLRPRKDLIETLLHEMIHALLFVTNNDKDRESHGPEFCKHMRRINRLTGANVTIYHSFHDEVDSYRQHWWRCNGPCQNRKPYFGYVKRSMNRAPSARDFWWVEHQQTCGGTFTKVKEPENFKKSKEKTQPTKLLDSESTNKGKSQTCLTPFSGKGYRLGEGDSGLSGKSTNSSISVRTSQTPAAEHRSVGTVPIPKNEIKFERSPRSGTFFPLYADDASKKINLASKREFPKLSVASTKAYRNVGGSPVKIARVMEERSNQDSVNGRRVTLPPEQICLQRTTTGQVAAEKKSSERTNTPHQWPKMEDKMAFENYFVKKGSTDVSLSVNSPMKTSAESTVSSANCSTAARQDKKVRCPVCQAEVLEPKINEHLDSCLA